MILTLKARVLKIRLESLITAFQAASDDDTFLNTNESSIAINVLQDLDAKTYRHKTQQDALTKL